MSYSKMNICYENLSIVSLYREKLYDKNVSTEYNIINRR